MRKLAKFRLKESGEPLWRRGSLSCFLTISKSTVLINGRFSASRDSTTEGDVRTWCLRGCSHSLRFKYLSAARVRVTAEAAQSARKACSSCHTEMENGGTAL